MLYPVFDVVAAVVDARSAGNTARCRAYVSVVISLVAAAGLVIAVTAGIVGILRVWAVVAGPAHSLCC